MTTTIPASARQQPIVAPVSATPLVDDKGYPSTTASQLLQQLYSWVVAMNRIIPCNASGTNFITLTMLTPQPLVTQYNDYETYAFLGDVTSTGAVTACVVTETGTLATISVFKANGGTAAGAGDVVAGRQYFFTYCDSLNSGAGGFVVR